MRVKDFRFHLNVTEEVEKPHGLFIIAINFFFSVWMRCGSRSSVGISSSSLSTSSTISVLFVSKIISFHSFSGLSLPLVSAVASPMKAIKPQLPFRIRNSDITCLAP